MVVRRTHNAHCICCILQSLWWCCCCCRCCLSVCLSFHFNIYCSSFIWIPFASAVCAVSVFVLIPPFSSSLPVLRVADGKNDVVNQTHLVNFSERSYGEKNFNGNICNGKYVNVSGFVSFLYDSTFMFSLLLFFFSASICCNAFCLFSTIWLLLNARLSIHSNVDRMRKCHV